MRLVKNLCVVLTVILAVALGYSLVKISRQSRRLAADQARRVHDLNSISQLQQALRHERLQEAHAEAADENSENALRSSLVQGDAALSASRRQLSAARAEILGLRAGLRRSRRRYQETLARATEQLRKQHEEVQTRLDTLKRHLDNAQAEVQASRLRVSALEAVNAKLSRKKSAASVQTQAVVPALRTLQPLERRRDAYVAALMSHYQEIASQLENMRGMLDARRDANSNVFSDEALHRIRDALSLANNDLRKLNDVSDQIRNVENQLARK